MFFQPKITVAVRWDRAQHPASGGETPKINGAPAVLMGRLALFWGGWPAKIEANLGSKIVMEVGWLEDPFSLQKMDDFFVGFQNVDIV